MSTSSWTSIGAFEIESLALAREQAHQAAQVVGAVGRTYNPKTKFDQFASFNGEPTVGIGIIRLDADGLPVRFDSLFGSTRIKFIYTNRNVTLESLDSPVTEGEARD